jgi:hypothetical protein
MDNMLNEYCGYRLIETTYITKKVQARTHRKKRINKKWLKRYEYKDVPDYNKIVVTNGCIFAQQKTIKRIIEGGKKYDR